MTEKNYNPEQKMKKMNKVQEQVAKSKPVVDKTLAKENKTENEKKVGETEEVKDEKDKKKMKSAELTSSSTQQIEKTKEKKITPKKKAPTKTEVVVNAHNVPVSTKYSMAICKFIKWKNINKAIEDLELVLQKKIAVPMKGEYAHRKSVKGIASGSGKFPQGATKHFITILKSLRGNANNHDVENAFISEAIANKAATPMARFGSWQRKRTNVTLKAKSRKKETNGEVK